MDRDLARTQLFIIGILYCFAKMRILNNKGSRKIYIILYIVPFIHNKNKNPPLASCYDAHNCFHCYLSCTIAVADKWLF